MKSFHSVMLACTLAIMFALGTPEAHAQCSWRGLHGVPGVAGLSEWYSFADERVAVTTQWDVDGPGPGASVLVAAGYFQFAGDIRANNIATWDGTSWSILGDGIGLYNPGALSDTALALGVNSSNHLIAAGYFAHAGGVPANNIAEWDGTAWQPLGDGLEGVVLAVAPLASNQLIAGGQFYNSASTPLSSIARWDGTAWVALGNGLLSVGDIGTCAALASLPGGDLIVAGLFDLADGVTANNIARLHSNSDGTFTWTPLGEGTNGMINAVLVAPNGDVFAAGDFTQAGGVETGNIARWDGATWWAVGSAGPLGTVLALNRLPSGDLVAMGYFDAVSGTPAYNIARWNGSSWSAMPGIESLDHPTRGGGLMSSTVLPSGDLIVGGDLRGGVASWSQSAWHHLGDGFDRMTNDVAVMTNGDIVVSGQYDSAPGIPHAQGLARFDGTTWHAMAPGNGTSVGKLLALPNSELLALGYQNGSDVVLRWNGSAWNEVMTSTLDLLDIVRHPSGDFYAAGRENGAAGVYRWTGAAWQQLGDAFELQTSPGFGAPVALTIAANGDIIAGGIFNVVGTLPAKNVARWDGTAWHAMAGGLGNPFPNEYENVTCLATLPNGDIIAAGNFGHPPEPILYNNVARWDGESWHLIGNGIDGLVAFDVAVSPTNGHVFVGGSLVTPFTEWDGSSWLAPDENVNGTVFGIAPLATGEVALAGSFTMVGTNPGAHFAIASCNIAACDAIDFNNDGLFPDTADIDDFLAVFAGLPCPSTGSACNTDIDFNNDGLFPDTLDIDSFLSVFSGNACV